MNYEIRRFRRALNNGALAALVTALNRAGRQADKITPQRLTSYSWDLSASGIVCELTGNGEVTEFEYSDTVEAMMAASESIKALRSRR